MLRLREGIQSSFSLLAASCLVLLLAIPSTVFADDAGVTFLYPTRGLTFHQFDVVNVTYLSPFATPELYIWCDGGARQIGHRQAVPYNGSMLEQLNFTSSTDCWFDLKSGTEPETGANSESFQVLANDKPVGATFGLTTSTSTKTTDSPSSATPSGNPTGSNSTAQADANRGLSSGASAGIGVGVSLVVILVAGALAAFWWRRRKANKGRAAAQMAMAEHSIDAGMGGGYVAGRSPAGLGPKYEPVMVKEPWEPRELGDSTVPIEMAAGEENRRPELP